MFTNRSLMRFQPSWQIYQVPFRKVLSLQFLDLPVSALFIRQLENDGWTRMRCVNCTASDQYRIGWDGLKFISCTSAVPHHWVLAAGLHG